MQTPLTTVLWRYKKSNSDFLVDLVLNLSRLRGELRLNDKGVRLEHPHPYARMVDQLLGQVVKNLPARSVIARENGSYLSDKAYSTRSFQKKIEETGDITKILAKVGQIEKMEKVYHQYVQKYAGSFSPLLELYDNIVELRDRGVKLFSGKVTIYQKKEFNPQDLVEEGALAVAKHGYRQSGRHAFTEIDPFQNIQGDAPHKYIQDLLDALHGMLPSANLIWTDKIATHKNLKAMVNVPDKQKAEAWWATLSESQTTGAFVCLLYTSPRPRDRQKSRMPSSA